MKNADVYDDLALNAGDLNAEQIVSRFAENAGLDLTDVVSNYAQYASAIQQSFTSQYSKPSSVHIIIIIIITLIKRHTRS